MQAIFDDGVCKVWKSIGWFWLIKPSIPTWNQDTNRESWKNLNKII